MNQCYGYIRVSTARQGEGVSLEAQKEAIQLYADRHNIIIKTWFEEKETAAKLGRKVFSEMVRSLKQRRANGVIIHKIDRSARNLRDWATIGELSDIGVDVHFATETLDFRSRGGRLTADIQAVIAADYIRNLREETVKGIRGRLKQGLYPFKAPIGYLDNGGGKPKTLDPVRAPLVRQAFELYASQEYSYISLLADLTRRGLKSDKGRPISMCCLETLLKNPFYCGLIEIKRTGEIFDGAHEPLISAALFERVQDIRSGKCGKKVTRHNHLFRGLFRCARCSGPMTPERQKGRVYYRCQTRGCLTKTVREDFLDETVRNGLDLPGLTDESVRFLIAGMSDHHEADDGAKVLRGYEVQLAEITQREDRLTDALIDRLIDQDTFAARKKALALERTRIEEMQVAEAKFSWTPEDLQKYLELVKSLKASYEIGVPEEKRRIIDSAFSNRTVDCKNLYLEPSNWLKEAQNLSLTLCGAPDRCTSRTLEQLIHSVRSYKNPADIPLLKII